MNAKKMKILTLVTTFLLTYLAFDLLKGATSTPARAEDDQGLFIPSVDDSWTSDSWSNQEQRNSSSLSPLKASRRNGAMTVASRRSAASKNSNSGNSEPAKETTATETIRNALPWAAGFLGFTGLAMVMCSLLSRCRFLPRRAVRSPAILLDADGGGIDREPTQTMLAFRLVQTDLPAPGGQWTGKQKKQKSRELRRAA